LSNSIYRAIAVSALLALASPLATAGDVSIGVTIKGEIVPGVYGRVDLANRPPPPLLYAQPVIIERSPPHVVVEPVYLHVPPGHAKNWNKHCREYHACGRPVYFVKSAEYEPGYRPDKHDRRDKHDRDHDRHD
jgi:hypothetical protein